MNTRPLRSLDKSLLTTRDKVSPYKYTASIKSSLTKGQKASDDYYRFQYQTQTSFFPQRQDRRDVHTRQQLVVDPKTGRLSYPSLLFRKKALKESMKKSLSKGSVVRGESEDEMDEEQFEDAAEEVADAINYAGEDEYRQYMAISKDIDTRQSTLYHHAEADEVSSVAEHEVDDREDEISENRKYSMYEDWRIIESIDEQINEKGIKGHLSKVLWRNLNDPMTGERLLDGTRSAESMRERYKRWLVALTDDDKDELRRFAREHTEAEMKSSCCSFKNVSGKRTFTGVSRDAMGTYSAWKFVNTPHKGSMKKPQSAVRYTEEKPTLPKIYLTKPADENQVRERLVFTESKADKKRQEVLEVSRISTTKKSPAKQQEVCSALKRRFVPVYDDDVETVDKQRVLDAEKLNKRNDEGEFRPRSKKVQKAFETPENGKVSYREIPGGKRLDFSQINLKDRFNSGLKGRKYIVEDFSKSDDEEESRDQDLNLKVYVDMNNMVRQFVKEREEKERRSRNIPKLIKIAERYGLKLDDALRLFNSVSGSYEDLRLYLESGDVNLLWTEDDDHGLILNNKTAVRYLKVIKGEKRMERRKMYLLGRFERRRRASQTAL